MVAYATVGTNNAASAMEFYDALLSPFGIGRFFDHPRGGAVYGKDGQPSFGVLVPYDEAPATAGNGSMTGFAMDNRAQVDAFHAKALELGGSCEGEPGLRGPEEMAMYFTYVRDREGNKLCAFKIG